MRGRVSGGYKSDRVRPDKKQDPFIVTACEGATEKNYLDFSCKGRSVRMRPHVYPGHHGRQLVDDAVALRQDYIRKSKDANTEVHAAVLYDLEIYSAKKIAEAIEIVKYAESQDVTIWISIPVIERWYHLHRAHIAITRSKNVVINALKNYHNTARVQRYKKPGGTLFYNDIIPYTKSAKTLCEASHIEEVANGKIPCICDLEQYVTDIASN